MQDDLEKLLASIAQCQICAHHLPFSPLPTLQMHVEARILVVGQAPGNKAHLTHTPWNDPSGDRLRQWLGVDRDIFYHSQCFSFMPMGFCYPGKDRHGGDKPPRPECAPRWHNVLRACMPNLSLTILIGGYAQRYYLQERCKATMTDTVKAWEGYLPDYIPLPHPSWRNTHWLKKNPWFEREVISMLRSRVELLL